MYAVRDYQTKKSLVDDFKAGRPIRVYQPGPFGPDVRDGAGAVEGPHYPKPHRFYVSVVVKNGYVVKIVK